MIFGSSHNYLEENGRSKKFKRKHNHHHHPKEKDFQGGNLEQLNIKQEKSEDHHHQESTVMASASFHTGGAEDWPLAYGSTGPFYAGPYSGGPSHSTLLPLDEFPSSYWSSSMALVDNYDLNEEDMHISTR